MNLLWTFGAALVAIACGIWLWRDAHATLLRHLPRTVFNAVLALRLGALLALLLILANPYYVVTSPDPDAYYVAVLADRSASMQTADLPDGQSRTAFISGQLARGAGDLRLRLERNHNLRLYSFSDTVSAFEDSAELLTGSTALGDALMRTRTEEAGSGTLGAVLVLSDGRNTTGGSVIDAAKAFRDAGIHVTAVAIGERVAASDVSVAFVEPPATVSPEEPLTLNVRLTNSFDETKSVTVVLLDGEQEQEQQAIDVPAGGEREVAFTITAPAPGDHLYRTKILDTVKADSNPYNNADAALVAVSERASQEVLFLADALDAEFRFVHQALDKLESLNLHAFIQLADQKVFSRGFEETPEVVSLEAFIADTQAFFAYDALVMSAEAAGRLPPEARERLRNFVDRRGGGLLLTGDASALPDDLRVLTPHMMYSKTMTDGRVFVEITPGFVFDPEEQEVLFARPLPFLPEREASWLPGEPKLGALPMAQTTRGDALLAVQRYGPGRSAYLGTAHTWRWRLSSERGQQQHRQFWSALLTWLATGRLERIEPTQRIQTTGHGDAVELEVTTRAPDYRPAGSAVAEVRITDEAGESTVLQMTPSAEEPGQYVASFQAGSPGVYTVDYTADLPDGDTLRTRGLVAVAPNRTELLDISVDEPAMRDLARVTGGDFYTHESIGALERLPVAAAVPESTRKVFWTRNAFWLILSVGVLCTEWFLRRRYGLS